MAVVTLEEVLTHQTRPWLALYGVMLKPRRHTEQHINEVRWLLCLKAATRPGCLQAAARLLLATEL